jgi:hypothetical protein
MADYIDAHKDDPGVEPICTTLQFAPVGLRRRPVTTAIAPCGA